MKRKLYLLILSVLTLMSCSEHDEGIWVKNTLDEDCVNETVKINKQQLNAENQQNFENLGVFDEETQKFLLTQKLDTNEDGVSDAMLFQPKVPANTTRKYKLMINTDTQKVVSKVYSRFVPERTDDYAWENDRVAFRTYGPHAQQLAEANDPTGTLSSGLDCWLKRVDYPIINKWYKKYTSGTGTYHVDTGEGLDNYHVNSSRGCGGIGVYENGKLYTSKNFVAYKTRTNGPIRTSFNLDYANWMAGEKAVSEQKLISLDLGNNLMRIEERIAGTDEIAAGITLHENTGTTFEDTVTGCFSYWQKLDDSELGTGLVIPAAYYNGYTKVESKEPDKSQLLVHLKVIDDKVVYYSGFGWKKSGQFANQQDWNNYLKTEAVKIKNPLEVSILSK